MAERQLHQPRLQPLVDAAKGGVGQERCVGRGEQRKAAVEIGTRAQMEAALMLAEMILRPADRVGPGHDGEVALDAAFGLRPGKHRHQRVDGDDARQLAGMECRLQIGRRSSLVGTSEAEQREFVGNPFAFAGDAFDRFLHDFLPQERETCDLKAPMSIGPACRAMGARDYTAGSGMTGARRSSACDSTATVTAKRASAAPTSGRLA